MCKRSFVVLDNRRGFVLGCSECQVISLIYRNLELCSCLRQNTRTFQAFKEYGKVILAFGFDHNENRISDARLCLHQSNEAEGQCYEPP